jgi:TetR/AcrR family transcriptional regulator, mexJK operon transcriptional repressor
MTEVEITLKEYKLLVELVVRPGRHCGTLRESCTVSAMVKVNKPASTPKSRSETKTDLLLETAAKFFLEKGFEGASVGEIARAAHASKETFYSRYATKEELFRAVMLRQTESISDVLSTVLLPHEPPEKALNTVGGLVLKRLTSDQFVAMDRALGMEARRFPELAKIFYESGPARLQALLAKYLDTQVAAGRLCQLDSQVAARRFIALVMAEMIKVKLGIGPKPTKSERDRYVRSAVDFFLRGYKA